MFRISTRFIGQAGTLLLVILTAAGCGLNIPATYVAPTPVPGTGTNPIYPPQVAPAPASRVFIENKKIRLGIDIKMGGAIVYLSESGGQNLVNNHDYGRQIQSGLYGGPIPYSVHGKSPQTALRTLGWNPVQAGDSYNNTSQLVTYRQDSTHLYVKTIPLQWPLYLEPAECIMEHWITLVNNTVQVSSRTTLNRQDTTQYTARPQEAPAVYVNGTYSHIQIYEGTQPFTGGSVGDLSILNHDEVHYAPECWVALLNEQGRGLGLFQPGQPRFNVGFFGKPGSGGEYDDPTGYLAGKEQAILDHNGVYDYQYTLVLGSLTDIRQFVYSQLRPAPAPDFRFVSDRQHWYYEKTIDTGLPVRGEIAVQFEGDPDLKLLSPEVFWRGSDVSRLYLQSAFTTPATTARLFWRRYGDQTSLPSADRYVDFPITGDGQYRTYELDMTQVPGWRDYAIIQVGLAPTKPDAGHSGQNVRIRSLTAIRP